MEFERDCSKPRTFWRRAASSPSLAQATQATDEDRPAVLLTVQQPHEAAILDAVSKARDIVRSAAIWSGFAGIVALGVPPMLLGYPLVLVDPNRAISDWYFRSLARLIVGINPFWNVTTVGKEKLEHG